MLKRNFILLSLVGLVLVISTTFEEENTDVEVLPNNENLDLSVVFENLDTNICLLYTSPSPRDATLSRMPSSA